MTSYRIHLEVDEFATRQRDDHLPLVDRAAHDVLLAGCAPLVDALVCSDVTNTVRINLQTNHRHQQL